MNNMLLSLRHFVSLVLLSLLSCTLSYAGTYHLASSDTTRPTRAKLNAPLTRRPAPMILPGTKLDTNFNALPAQDPVVHKVAPAWLRAKATGKPMYVVDGKVATPAQLRQLQQKQVASVKVLEGRKAAKLYGRNARQGMVVITTNAGLQPKP